MGCVFVLTGARLMSEYKRGYCQAKADALGLVKEATQTIAWGMTRATPEQAVELRARVEGLRWVRAQLRAMKVPK